MKRFSLWRKKGDSMVARARAVYHLTLCLIRFQLGRTSSSEQCSALARLGFIYYLLINSFTPFLSRTIAKNVNSVKIVSACVCVMEQKDDDYDDDDHNHNKRHEQKEINIPPIVKNAANTARKYPIHTNMKLKQITLYFSRARARPLYVFYALCISRFVHTYTRIKQ